MAPSEPQSSTPSGSLRRGLDTAAGITTTACTILVSIVLLIDVLLELAEIVARDFLHSDLNWTPQAATLAIMALGFLGGAIAYRRRQLLRLTVLTRRMSREGALLIDTTVRFLIVGITIGVALLSVGLFREELSIHIQNLPIAQAWGLLPLPVGMAMIAFFAVVEIAQVPWWVVAYGAAISASVVLLLGVILHYVPVDSTDSSHLVLLTAVTLGIASLFLGMPIAIVFVGMSFIYCFATGAVPWISIPLDMQDGLSGQVLIAVPFFLLAGFLLVESELALALADALLVLTHRISHNVLYSLLGSMLIFSGISGSKAADMAAVGGPMARVARREGYDPADTVAVLSSAAVMADTVPPAVALLVLASISTLSVGALFAAGILPAAVMAIVLGFAVYVLPHPRQPTETSRTNTGILRAIFRAIPVALIPAFLIAAILFGLSTPTDASVLAVTYCVVIGLLLYRSLSVAGLQRSFSGTVSLSGSLMMVIASAIVFSRLLARANIPDAIVDGIRHLHGDATLVFLVLSIVTLVVMGMFLEGAPALLMFAPILLPVAQELGVSELQYGIILVMAMGLGSHTPPIGIGVYVACLIVGVEMEDATRAIGRYYGFLFGGLVLVTFVPEITLAVPRLLGVAN